MKSLFEEAKEKWGQTKAFKESVAKVSKMSKEDMARIQTEQDLLMKEIAKNMSLGAKNPLVQGLIERHYNALRAFYEPTLQIYRGLAQLYVSDSRFGDYFDKYAKGLAPFMKEAIEYYCDTHQ